MPSIKQEVSFGQKRDYEVDAYKIQNAQDDNKVRKLKKIKSEMNITYNNP